MSAVFLTGGPTLQHPQHLPCRIPGIVYIRCLEEVIDQSISSLRILVAAEVAVRAETTLLCSLSCLLLLFCCVAFLSQQTRGRYIQG